MLQLTSLGYVVMGWIAVLFVLANIFLLELQAQTVSEAETMFRTDVMLSPPGHHGHIRPCHMLSYHDVFLCHLHSAESFLARLAYSNHSLVGEWGGEVVREGRFGAQFRAVVELSKGLLNCSSDKLSPDSVISMDTMGRCCFVV